MPASRPAHVAGGDDAEVEFLALFEDVRPHVVGVEHGVVQVDLEPDLGGEPGARDRHRMAVQGVVDQPVVGDVADVGAE